MSRRWVICSSIIVVRLLLVFVMAGLLCAQTEDLATKAQHGKEAMAAGEFDEAARLYAELVKAVPGNPGLIVNLGMAQFMAGRPGKAIPHFEVALKLQPGLLPAMLFLGASYVKVGQPAKAVAPLRKVVASQPGHAAAQQVLGGALLSLDRYAEALEHFHALSRLDGKNPRAWYGLGKCYEALSQRAFYNLEKTAPGSAYWLALIAGARQVQQQERSAFYFYREALAKQPGMRGLHAALAEIYRKSGHPDWAAIEEEKENKLGPINCAVKTLECDFAAAHYRELLQSATGRTTPESYYWQSRAYDALAREAFTRLAQLPPSVEIHELTAQVHRNQGRHLEAVKEWKDALKLAPGDPGLRMELAISLHQSRDYPAAVALLEDLLKGAPDSAELNYLLGDSLLNLQQGEKAIVYLAKAVRRAPKNFAAHASLARAYLQAGQSTQAVPHLKAALPIDKDGSLHFQLSRAYQGSGERELAKQMLEKYQEIRKSVQAEADNLEEEIQITAP